jgi:hypothetical protein
VIRENTQTNNHVEHNKATQTNPGNFVAVRKILNPLLGFPFPFGFVIMESDILYAYIVHIEQPSPSLVKFDL